MSSFDLSVPFAPSPNFSDRKGREVVGCVVHYTGGGSAGGAVSWLCNPQSKASSHFVISRTGKVIQLVALEQAAWHAGVSEMVLEECEGNANQFTIGIELANHGFLQRLNGSFYYELGRSLKRYRREDPGYGFMRFDNGLHVAGWWERYPDVQIDALQELLVKLGKTRYRKAASNLVGHEEIAMPLGRKRDPGPMFPWNRFLRRIDRRTKSETLLTVGSGISLAVKGDDDADSSAAV